MAVVEWTDAEREAMQATARAHQMDNGRCACGYDPVPGFAFVNDWGRHMAEKVVMALAPFVAARALREFGPWVQQEHACDPEEECPEGTCRLCDLLFAVYADANDRADRIERGES